MKGESHHKGFTLIELMIVVAIIGILVAIAVPMFSNFVAKSQEGSTKANMGAIRSALSIYFTDNEGLYPVDNLSTLIQGTKYLQIIPLAILPATQNSVGHGTHAGVNTGQFPANITDVSGGLNVWAYDNSGPANNTWGQIVVNCSHKDIRGYVWTSY